MTSGGQVRANPKLLDIIKKRGGKIFYKNLERSLCVRAHVERRIASKVGAETPIVVHKVPVLTDRVEKVTRLKGEKKCCKNFFDPKKFVNFGAAKLNQAQEEKFFCLPVFSSQTSEQFRNVPASVKDKARFLFVDISKFCPRNAASVAHGVIFDC